jgi:hypothetical protein
MSVCQRALPAVLAGAILCLAQQIPRDSVAPAFHAQSDLVLVPFHVTRGNLYVQDWKAADAVLLEDGHPRDFTTFEGPDTKSQTPIELVLLFDTTIVPWGWITPAQYARGGPYDSKEVAKSWPASGTMDYRNMWLALCRNDRSQHRENISWK